MRPRESHKETKPVDHLTSRRSLKKNVSCLSVSIIRHVSVSNAEMAVYESPVDFPDISVTA